MEVDNGGYATPTPWDDPTWRQDALDWITDQLSTAGLAPADLGTIRVRTRPWSVVIQIPARTGDVWFKANPPSSAFEPALMAALAEWAPVHVLRPIAVDIRRSWSLLPHGGPLLPAPSAASWIEPLRQYADLQLATADRLGDLVALGLPDLRPQVIPDRFDELLAEVGERDGMAEVAALRPRIVDWAAELAGRGVPPALDHSDLHNHQIFDRGEGRYAFFDWGDASVGHPFTSLLVPMRMIRDDFGAEAAAEVRDAYLDGWAGDREHLRRMAHLACQLGPVSRALSWMRIFIGERGPVHEFVVGWLRVLLEEPPI